MNIYALVNAFNSIFSLVAGIILLARKERSGLHFAFAMFALLISAWTFSYVMWSLQTELSSSLQWHILLLSATCFIHVAYFHFILLFCGVISRYRFQLLLCYLTAIFFAIINVNSGFFDLDYIRIREPSLFWPHGTIWVLLFILTEAIFIIYSFKILIDRIKESSQPLKARLKFFLAMSIVGWSGGCTNWFNFFDVTPIPPVGNPAVTLYLISMFYMIVKHDFLISNITLRRTFIYALLTAVVTLIFTITILVSERLFQSVVGYNSFMVTVFAAAIITLIFAPFRNIFSQIIDRYFFGKNIENLSQENDLMKSELVKADHLRSVATLAAGMAHEIKNPLTSIKTFAEYLPDKYQDVEFRQKFKQIVSEEVDRINSIVTKLLEFSRPKKLLLMPTQTQLIIDDTLELLNSSFLKSNIRVIKYYSSWAEVYIDRAQIKQVLLNVCLNAIQAMPNGGALTVRTALSGKYDEINISDTGIGIPADNLKRIFDPFFSTKESGTGLGLSIVHGIIREHNGIIVIKSTISSGTQVTIRLPLAN